MTGHSELEQTIASTLEKRAPDVRAAGRGAWEFHLLNGRPLPVSARWEDEWLMLRAPFGTAPVEDLDWRLLVLNGGLRGPARIVRSPTSRRIELRADIPLLDVDMVSARLEAACASLQRVSAEVTRHPTGESAAHAEIAVSEKDDRPWAQLAAEHGWPVSQREGDRTLVELDTPGLFNQALVENRGAEVALSLELLRTAAVSEMARQAMALYLLTLTGVLRMVGAAASGETPHTVRLEVRLPSTAAGIELDLALSALSLAARMATREVRALGDDLLAELYLSNTTTED